LICCGYRKTRRGFLAFLLKVDKKKLINGLLGLLEQLSWNPDFVLRVEDGLDGCAPFSVICRFFFFQSHIPSTNRFVQRVEQRVTVPELARKPNLLCIIYYVVAAMGPFCNSPIIIVSMKLLITLSRIFLLFLLRIFHRYCYC